MASTHTGCRRAPTDAEREQRRAEQRELVIASVDQLRSSAGWQAYLRGRRTFHIYCLVIWRAGVIHHM